MNTAAQVDPFASARLDSASFRAALGTFTTGVTVVTTAADGELYGLTVNSFTSVSLDPMLVLICLNDGSRGVELLDRSGAFSVNILAAGQGHISRQFADRNRPTGAAAFAQVSHRIGATGCPNLTGAAAVLDCRVHQTCPAGDHVIVIGEVVELVADSGRAPLVFHSGRYRALGGPIEPTNPTPVNSGARPPLHVVATRRE